MIYQAFSGLNWKAIWFVRYKSAACSILMDMNNEYVCVKWSFLGLCTIVQGLSYEHVYYNYVAGWQPNLHFKWK